MTSGILVLEDGSRFEGKGIGARGRVRGELVFNTSMSGYQEVLTDPSYRGQVVTFTMPHIGNYGVNDEDMESIGGQVCGLVVRRMSRRPSNHRSTSSLNTWLIAQGIPGVEGIDTREVTRRVRDKGVMRCGIVHGPEDEDSDLFSWMMDGPAYEDVDYVAQVRSPAVQHATLHGERVHFGEGHAPDGQGPHIVVLDFGVKHSILRHLLQRGARVTTVPSNLSAGVVDGLRPSGVLVSNGPGDPAILDDEVALVTHCRDRYPTFGICLGHQLLARSYGAETFKLRFGHRGPNQPVRDEESGVIRMTSQNHGYAVSRSSLPDRLQVTEVNLNDDTVAAFQVAGQPVFGVQYHPEAGPGPNDATLHFDRFIASIGRDK